MGSETQVLDLMKGIRDDVRGFGEDLASVKGKVSTLDVRIREIEDKGRKRATLPGVKEEAEKEGGFSFRRLIAAIAAKDRKLAPFELDVCREAAKRKDLSTDGDSLGGYLVPEEFVADLIELKRSQTVVRQMGARVLEGLTSSPVVIPKQTAASQGFWIGEGSSIPKSDPTLGQVTLRPHEAAARTVISNRFLRMGQNGEQFVREDLAATLARLIDLAALRGSGAGGEPLGIVNTPGIKTVDFGEPDGGDPTIEKLYDMVAQVELTNTPMDRMGWVFHTLVWNQIRKLRSDSGAGPGTGDFFLQRDPTQGNRPTLLGHPFLVSNQLPTDLVDGASTNLAEIFFGNWRDLWIGEWGGMEIAASSETDEAFARNQTHVRIIQEVDVAPRHADSFCVANDVKTA